MSLLNGARPNGGGSTISADGGGRRVVRSVSHAGSPPPAPSSVGGSSSSSLSSSGSSSSSLALEDLPLVLSILLEVEARQRSSPAPSPTTAQEGQAWVAKIREALDDALDDAEQDESALTADETVARLAGVLGLALLGPDGKWASSLEMVLKLEPRSGQPILNHPLFSSAVEHLWSKGASAADAAEDDADDLADLHDDPQRPSLGRRYARYLDSLCTPHRLHALVLGSKALYLAFALSVLLYPGGLISVDVDPSAPKPSVNRREVLWIVWTIGAVCDSVTRDNALSTVLPTFALFSLRLSPSLAYPLLTLALPGLLFAPLSPRAPSLAHLAPLRNVWLPPAAYASLLLRRVLKPLGLLLAPLLAVFALVALAFNGDPWRLGFASSLASPLVPGPLPTPAPEPTPGPGPLEPGVAPFGVRLWLAISFTLLLALGLLVGCARIAPPPGRSRFGSTPAGEDDRWAAEWGPEAADSARRERVRALCDFLPSSADRAAASDSTSAAAAAYRRPSTSAPSLLESQPLLTTTTPDDSLAPYRPLVLPPPVNLLPTLATPYIQLGVRVLHRALPAEARTVKVDGARAAVDRWVWRGLAFVLRLDGWEWLGRKVREAAGRLGVRAAPAVRLE